MKRSIEKSCLVFALVGLLGVSWGSLGCAGEGSETGEPSDMSGDAGEPSDGGPDTLDTNEPSDTGNDSGNTGNDSGNTGDDSGNTGDDSGNTGEPQGCDPLASGTGLNLATMPSFAAAVSGSTPIFTSITDHELAFFPDGAVTLLGGPGAWEGYLTVGNATYRLAGPDPTSMTLSPLNPVLAPTGSLDDPYHGYAGATSVLDCGEARRAFFHAEYHEVSVPPTPGNPPPYHASMCRATASEENHSFVPDDTPWVISSSGAAVYAAPKEAYGAGGGAIFDPGGSYLYMYYFDWDGTQGVHLARACRSECGAPGTWRKWDGTGFVSEALGDSFLSPSGYSESILAAGPAEFDAFNVVSFNTYLNAYLMVSHTESGIALRASADGLNWGPRVVLLAHIVSADATMRVIYPTVFDAETWSRDLTGRQLKLVYPVEADELGARATHRARVVDIELSLSGDTQSVSYDRVTLKRYYSVDAMDHWSTTSLVEGYQDEGGQGRLAANSLPGTRPLYDCVLGENNHMASTQSACEGGTSLGVLGYAWVEPGPGLHSLFRCSNSTSDGRLDHFISLDQQCEGATFDALIGYAE